MQQMQSIEIQRVLRLLVVVGPELPNSIVYLRESCGGFKSIEALDDGGGIGPSLPTTSGLKIVIEHLVVGRERTPKGTLCHFSVSMHPADLGGVIAWITTFLTAMLMASVR